MGLLDPVIYGPEVFTVKSAESTLLRTRSIRPPATIRVLSSSSNMWGKRRSVNPLDNKIVSLNTRGQQYYYYFRGQSCLYPIARGNTPLLPTEEVQYP